MELNHYKSASTISAFITLHYITGLLVILSLVFLTPYFNYIPDAALSAVIIAAVADLVDFTLLAELWRVNSKYI